MNNYVKCDNCGIVRDIEQAPACSVCSTRKIRAEARMFQKKLKQIIKKDKKKTGEKTREKVKGKTKKKIIRYCPKCRVRRMGHRRKIGGGGLFIICGKCFEVLKSDKK